MKKVLGFLVLTMMMTGTISKAVAGMATQYYLYIGAHYPYHDFTVIVPRKIAKRFSIVPEWYFDEEYICVTGLITHFDGKAEMFVNRTRQIHLY